MQRLCHRLLVATGTPKRCATRCRRACACTPAQCVAARCLCGVAPIGSERPLCSSHIREVILTLALPGTRRRARARATRTRERSFHPVRTGVRPGWPTALAHRHGRTSVSCGTRGESNVSASPATQRITAYGRERRAWHGPSATGGRPCSPLARLLVARPLPRHRAHGAPATHQRTTATYASKNGSLLRKSDLIDSPVGTMRRNSTSAKATRVR